MPSHESLPYRPCAGMMVFNRAGLVFIGRRTDGPEHVDATHVWQMPQGGIDEDEDPYKAALRELHEETNIRSVKKLGEIGEWLTYDLPPHLVGIAFKGKFRGQKQKWFALRFLGADADVNLRAHQPQEFDDWKWVKLAEVVDLIIPFKRAVYEQVVKEFAALAVPIKSGG